MATEKEYEYVKMKSEEYLEALKERGIDIEADKNIVDWKTAARRWGVLCLMDGKSDEWSYGGIGGDIDVMKYEAGYSHVPIILTTMNANRICRGGDCRGEPYYMSSYGKQFISCRCAETLISAIEKISSITFEEIDMEAFNGYYYKIDVNNKKIEEIDKKSWKTVGQIKYECKGKGCHDISIKCDTTSLFKWNYDEKPLTKEEDERYGIYTDDGCDY